MVLKKPSDYFKKDIATVNESVQELVKTPELNTFSDAFESFKNNLSKIEVLSEFSDTLDNYRANIEKVNYLSEKVEDIQTEVQSLLKKEDLDRAMMSQLLVVEQSIRDVQSKVKGINEKNLTEIRLDVSGLTDTVNEFLEVEVPKYKKLVVDSEIRTNNRYEELEENVSRTLEGIGEFVDNKYQELTESLQGINEESLASIIGDFKSLDKIVSELKEQEIPKYKGFIVESERKTESKLNEFRDKLDETLESFDGELSNKVNDIKSSVVEIDEKFEKLKEHEIPKYRGFIVETELKTESKLNEFQYKLDETVNSILEKVDLIEGDKTDLVDAVNQKIKEIKNIRNYVVEDLKNSEEYKKQINKKVTDLEVEIVRNESHIKVQNKNLEQIQEDVRSAIQKLDFETLEEKNQELTKKIKYLEEIFDKFNEKEILTENIIVEPPSTDNKDPLTPLDQNFVTLDQLQQHYRLFINRIQQQLATIGGGGETRLEFLDDVDRNSAKQNGYVLQYNSSVGKFIGTSYVPGGGGTGEISIQQDNVVVGTAVTVLNFSGLGISSVTASSGIATINVGGSTRNVSTYTSTEGQTTFAATYTVGFVDVFLNGSKLSQTQYIASNGTSVFLTEGASADDIVEIVSYDTLQIVPTTVSNFIVRDEGTLVGASVTSLNFVGTGVSASVIGNDATITIQGGGSGESYWTSTTAGIHTLSNVGIGTTNPTAKLDIVGDVNVSGVVTATSFSGITTSMVVGLSTVSSTGSYNDLTNKPTALSSFSNDVGFITTYTETSTLNDVLSRGNISDIGISVGVVTATAYYGDGSNLTGVAPQISPVMMSMIF